MPRSSALWTTLLVLSKSMRPLKLLQPSPITETSRPDRPRLRCSTDGILGGDRDCAAAVGADDRRRGVAAEGFLEEVVLDFPDIVDAKPVGEFDLIERLLITPQLGILGPGLRQLMLVEKPEFHPWRPLYDPRGFSGRPAQDCGGDLVGFVELREVTGAGDRGDFGLAGDRSGEAVGVAARHDAVLLAPDQQGRRSDQRQAFFEPGVAERPKGARRSL